VARLFQLAFGITALLTSLSAPISAQDVIQCKDGRSYKGRIVAEIPSTNLTLRDLAGHHHSIAWEDIRIIKRGEWPGRKSAGFSWALSFFGGFGMGQFYNGDHAKGVVMALTAIGSFVWLQKTDESLATFGASSLLVADWVWGFLDAPFRTHSINRANGYVKLNQSERVGWQASDVCASTQQTEVGQSFELKIWVSAVNFQF